MKLYLITGFLGSGKTTCINQLLNSNIQGKVGIIVNEFGSEGIDGRLIRSDSGLEMIELNNGSIFCQCIKEDFISALCDFQNYDFDSVFIEASGLADHSNMLTILETVKKITNNEYEYEGSICIVDGVYFLEQIDLLPVLERQIKYSNVVIINKVDLQTGENIKKIEDKIKQLNDKAFIYKSSYCECITNDILNKVSEPNIESQESTNTITTRPYSCVLEIEENVGYENLVNFIKEIMFATYRIKGFAKTDCGVFRINCVNNIFKIEENDEYSDEKYNVVVISNVGIKIIRIINEFSKKFNVKVNIRR